MPLATYKVLHLLGAFFAISAVSGVALHAALGGRKDQNSARALAAALHGLGVLIVLVAGFGMLAKLGLHAGFPGWVWAKLLIWLIFGGAMFVPYRLPSLAKHLLWLMPVLAAAATYLAVFKPF